MKRRLFYWLVLMLCAFVSKSQQQEPFLNFAYQTTDSSTHFLYDSKTPYILLYFYNPECEDCLALKKYLKKDKPLNAMIAQDSITVIAIPPQVEKSLWLANIDFIPKTWINGWCANDREIITTYLYGKQAPILFLLDHERKIILTDIDASFTDQFLEQYFKRNEHK